MSLNAVKYKWRKTNQFLGAWNAHWCAEEIELHGTLGNRLIEADSWLQAFVEQQVGAGQTPAQRQLITGTRTAAAVRVARAADAVHVRVLQVRAAGNTVRTVLEAPTRAAVLRPLGIQTTQMNTMTSWHTSGRTSGRRSQGCGLERYIYPVYITVYWMGIPGPFWFPFSDSSHSGQMQWEMETYKRAAKASWNELIVWFCLCEKWRFQ